jgi:DNA-binding transcriptional MerR regulator
MKQKAGYIGIKEASQLVGVHPDTIRRLIKQHKGSSNIVQGKGEKAPYYLNADWLKSIYGLNEPHTAPVTGDNQKDDTEPTTDTNKAISAMYEAQITRLELELKEKGETIKELLNQHKDLISQQQQLQDQLKFILLPANTGTTQPVEADIAETPTKPVYNKPKKPQSRHKTTTKQVKKPTKQGNKPATMPVDNKPKSKKKAPEKKKWWKF